MSTISSTPLALPYFLYLCRKRRDIVSLVRLSQKARELILILISCKYGDNMFPVLSRKG